MIADKLPPEKRQERSSLFRKVCITGAVLAAYYLFVRLTGLSIPCLFRLITGLKCPGCGITHMAMHMARFEWSEAFRSNPLLFVLLPIFGVLFAVKLIFMPDWLENKSRFRRIGEMVCLALVMVFWVVRNIVGI